MSWRLLSKYRTELMGIASIWVMLYHNKIQWPDALEPVRYLVSYGNLGVDIFLLLSGVGLYFAWQKKPALKEFYIRRLRPLAAAYLVLAVPYWVWRDLYEQIGDFWLNLTQLSFPLQGIRPAWYLPAAAVLYLLYPLIARFLFSGRTPVRTAVLCGGIIAACAALHYSGNAIYRNCEIALTRGAIFVIGCALGKAVYDSLPMGRLALPLSLGWLVCNDLIRRFVRLERVWVRFSYIPLCLAVCVILTFVLDKCAGRERLRAFLRFFGERSLPLYLTHMFLRNIVYHYVSPDCLDPWGFVSYGLILAGAVALSALVNPLLRKLSRPAVRKKEALS